MSDQQRHQGGTPLDEHIIETLREMLGDGLAVVVREFTKVTPQRLEDLRVAADRHDAEAISNLSHTLRGSSANLGLAEFSERCRVLETQARAGNVTDAAEYVAEIIREYDRIQPHLERLM